MHPSCSSGSSSLSESLKPFKTICFSILSIFVLYHISSWWLHWLKHKDFWTIIVWTCRSGPAPQPRWQTLPATRCLGGRATGVGGGGWRDAQRAPRPPPGPAGPPPGPARRGMAGRAARPPLPSPLAGAVPLCPRAHRSPLPRRAGRGREGGVGPRGRAQGRGEALLLAGCAAWHPPRGWPWPWPHVEQR
jgi:hypothetical protein